MILTNRLLAVATLAGMFAALVAARALAGLL